jgi:hypothetical protein
VDEHLSRADLTTAAESLRAILAAITAGKIPADLDHAAYLRGAADTLAMLAEPLNDGSTDSSTSSGDRPETKVSTHGDDPETGTPFQHDS